MPQMQGISLSTWGFINLKLNFSQHLFMLIYINMLVFLTFLCEWKMSDRDGQPSCRREGRGGNVLSHRTNLMIFREISYSALPLESLLEGGGDIIFHVDPSLWSSVQLSFLWLAPHPHSQPKDNLPHFLGRWSIVVEYPKPCIVPNVWSIYVI